MTMPQVQRNDEVSLDNVILLIRKTGNDMGKFTKVLTKQPAENLLRNLRIAVDKIGSAPVRRPPPLEKYMLQWSEFQSGKRKDLDRGTIRYLCWEPDIATSNQFLTCVQGSGMELGRRPLEGLVRSCHSKWEGSFPSSSPVDRIRRLVGYYQGHNPVLVKWKSNLDAILGEQGPEILARGLISEQKSLYVYLNEWYLESQSPFVQKIVEAATAGCRKQLDQAPGGLVALLFRELLPWPGWDLSVFKKEVGACILHKAVTGNIQEVFEKFVLTHKELGDPRMPANQIKWAQVPKEARDRVLRWLCREEVFSFLDHVYREDDGWGWQRRDDSTGSVRFGYNTD
jgi:hypothetical protein